MRRSFDGILGIHTHNDCELAVANALAAVEQGFQHVQGCINGYGERCGNANLTTIIANLELKMGHTTIGKSSCVTSPRAALTSRSWRICRCAAIRRTWVTAPSLTRAACT